MKDEDKTKEQLISELVKLRRRIAELEASEAECKCFEQALRKSEERYRSLTNDVLDTTGVGMLILDKDFRVVWLNQALERYFSLRKDEVIGKDKRQLIRERLKDIFEDSETFAEKVFATYDNNTYIESFECHVLPEGEREERWLDHWSQPIQTGLYAGGRVEHYTDITERKRADEERVHCEKLQSILEITGAVCHELNQPLQAISGYSDVLLMHISEGNLLHEKVKKILEQIVRMTNITKKLMGITRYETKDYLKGKIVDIDKASSR